MKEKHKQCSSKWIEGFIFVQTTGREIAGKLTRAELIELFVLTKLQI